jgi:signal transduction histidine kinase
VRFGNQFAAIALLVGVLAPTACVLWFMNVAIENQRGAARQKLTEAYRGQLTLLRDRVDSYWENRAGDLEREAREGTAPEIFERLVLQGGADAAVCLNRDGSVEYPLSSMPLSAQLPDLSPDFKRSDWMAAQALETVGDFPAAASAYAAIAKTEPDISLAARAVQARIRSLLRSGDKKAALQVVEESFGSGRLARAAGQDGRVIAADEQLLAFHLLSPQDRRYAATVARLHGLLADYTDSALPASQRLFLMEELRALPGASAAGDFPTYAAERLASQFVEAGRIQSGRPSLEASGLPDTWKLTLPGGRVIVLYRTATVIGALGELSKRLDATVTLTPPGLAAPAAVEWMTAGPSMPGWQMSLSPVRSGPDETERRRTISYLGIGFLAIAVVAITTLVAGQAIRRQWRLARLKTDLVAAVSHELKTPLSSMRVLVDSLLDDENANEKKTREYLELIARENLRLSRLIENFLTFSRLERNRQFEFRTTQPDLVVRATLQAMQERLPDSEGQFEVNVAQGLPAVRADGDGLVTVLLNLLDNAYKYTPIEKHIALKVFRRETCVVFAVEDNGIGIAPREQKRIFRRFYQVDHRLARETRGCGLGLSIVESIVKAHGGSIQVTSEFGRGSTFSVVLPCASAMKGAA